MCTKKHKIYAARGCQSDVEIDVSEMSMSQNSTNIESIIIELILLQSKTYVPI